MSWREERDALIEQTLAFVQSVTGKPAEFTQLAPPPALPNAVPPFPEVPTKIAGLAAATGHDGSQEPADHTKPIPPFTSPSTGTADAAAAPAESITGHPFTSIASQLGLQRDMQTEIRARVASFRANQERFNRERQEYFSATLERLRGLMNDVGRPEK